MIGFINTKHEPNTLWPLNAEAAKEADGFWWSYRNSVMSYGHGLGVANDLAYAAVKRVTGRKRKAWESILMAQLMPDNSAKQHETTQL
jgi:hypothetical protein